MTTGASRRRSRVRDHNGIAEVVAARIRQFANRGWGDKIGATQKVQALGARLPSRPPRQLEGGTAMDIISVNTFWTIWLLLHLLLAVALLGALTHQAVSAVMPVRQVAGPGGFVTRFRAVPAAGYATAVCVLWILTFIVGSYIYTKYRIYIRIPIEQAGYWKTQGFFDFKEHVASIGLTLLPAYWFFWKNAQNPQYDTARKMVTVYLAIACWFLFIVGHVLNNVRGFGS
jgi:hypothetical protein